MLFRKLRYTVAVIPLLGFALASAATLYKSVGPDGRVIYSDRPPKEGKVEKTLNFTDLPATPLPDSIIRYREELQQSLNSRLSAAETPMPGVRLFTAEWCNYCKKAKAYLGEKGIPYREYDIDKPDGKLAFARAKKGSGIPLLIKQEKHIQGFTKAAYDSFFSRDK